MDGIVTQSSPPASNFFAMPELAPEREGERACAAGADRAPDFCQIANPRYPTPCHSGRPGVETGRRLLLTPTKSLDPAAGPGVSASHRAAGGGAVGAR